MGNSRHTISDDFIIQDLGDLTNRYFTKSARYAQAGSMPSEKAILFAAQSNEILIYDTTYTAGSSASPFSFFSGTQDLPFSVSCWFYLTGTPSATAILVCKGNWPGGAAREWALTVSTSNRVNFLLEDESQSSRGTRGKFTSSALSTGQWYHVVATYSGNEDNDGCKIYVNGSAVTISHSGLSTGTYAGMDTSAGGYYGFIGGSTTPAYMSDVSIWSTELSAANVTSMYNSGVPTNLAEAERLSVLPIGSLVSWWRMGNEPGDVIKAGGSCAVSGDNIIQDASGNRRHAKAHTGFEGDEIVTNIHPKSARPGTEFENPDGMYKPKHAPFNLVNRGVPNLRKRNSAYKVTKS